MEDVPQETLLLVFSFLQPSDSLRVCLTCKNWTELWQDKALWKHFHFKFLGGKPHPPLLPKAWLKSVREFFTFMKTTKEPEALLKYAIEQGRSAVIDKILTDHPSLLYPIPFRDTFSWLWSGDEPHPLILVAQYKDNLNAMKVVWEHLIKTSSTDDHVQSQPTTNLSAKKKTAAQITRKAIRRCIEALFHKSGSAEMLEYMITVSPVAKSFVQKRGNLLFDRPYCPWVRFK